MAYNCVLHLQVPPECLDAAARHHEDVIVTSIVKIEHKKRPRCTRRHPRHSRRHSRRNDTQENTSRSPSPQRSPVRSRSRSPPGTSTTPVQTSNVDYDPSQTVSTSQYHVDQTRLLSNSVTGSSSMRADHRCCST